MVADNQIAELSEINRATLADIIGELDTGDFDLDLTGFELADVEEIMTAAPPDQSDLSEKLTSSFKIEITFESEHDLEEAYNNLTESGYECKILTL